MSTRGGSGVALRVLATGPLCLVEDLGRPGLSAIGVGRSGAADRASLRLANRAVGNDEGVAALEVTLGGLEVEPVGGHVTFCVCGAPCAVTVDGRSVGPYAVAAAGPGSVVRLGSPARGLRSYVAVRGGLDVAPVLGSRSRDVLGELGPPPVEVGDLLPVTRAGPSYPLVDGVAPLGLGDAGAPVVLRVVRGPRDGWIGDVEPLVAQEWTVSDRSNRVGIRLDGPALAHRPDAPLLVSEGVWRGAVQVPPGGEPVLFLGDHPVTGGYPVVAVVVDADVDRAAQLRPGESLRLRWVPAPS